MTPDGRTAQRPAFDTSEKNRIVECRALGCSDWLGMGPGTRDGAQATTGDGMGMGARQGWGLGWNAG